MTSGGSTVTTVASGSVVTLTATVIAGSTPVTVGQVNFCDAAVTYCTDIHLLATAQLTSAGTAVYKFRPGVGSHSYKAVFVGTPHGATNYGGSASSVAALTVSGIPPSITTIAQGGSAGNYTLTATVGGNGSSAPTGTVSFLNTSDGNAVLGTAALGEGTTGLELLNMTHPAFNVGSNGQDSVVTGDFNGDGIPDLATIAGIGQYPLGVFLGNGNGTFTPSGTGALAGLSPAVWGALRPLFIATSDFNGDGIPDLAVISAASISGGDGSVAILLGNGDGTFRPAAAFPATGVEPYAMAIADFNGDGIPDLAVSCVGGTANLTGEVTILLGNGDGTFTPGVSPDLPGGTGNPSIVTGDFNGDGIPDLALASVQAVQIALGNGDGTFAPPISISQSAGSITSLVAADFNHDGNLDLATLNYNLHSLAILLGDGKGNFTATSTNLTTSSLPNSAIAGDFNGDGIPDLAVVNSGGVVSTFLGMGDGTFTAGATWAGAGTGLYQSIAAGDLNGDGVSDLAVLGPSVPEEGESENGLTVLLAANQTATATANGFTQQPSTCAQQVVASYPGDSNYSADISGAAILGVLPGVPVVTVTPSSTSVTTQGSLSVTVEVGCGTTNLVPTGAVTLTVDNHDAGTVDLSFGSATFDIQGTSLTAGTEALTATYAPDNLSVFSYSTSSSTASVNVIDATFALSATTASIAAPGASGSSTITVTPSGGFTGSVVLSCAVTASPSGALDAPACSVASPVTISGTSAVTAALNLTTQAATTPGSYTVTVTGTSGSQTVTANVNATVAPPIGMTAPTITVTPSTATITNAQSDTVTVTVAGSGVTPTGAVSLASGSYSAQQALASGSASFTIPAGTLSAGANTLTATYSGDGTYASATGTVTVTVSPVAMAIPAPAAVAPGTSATATATLTAGSTYSGTLNLTCALTQSPSGAQSLPTCSLNPMSVTLAAGASGTTMLTVKTTAASTAALARPTGLNPWQTGGETALAGLLLLGIPWRRKKWLPLLAVAWVAMALMTNGCGGGGSSSSTPPVNTIQATTAGNYVFTVTGTDSSNTNVSVSAAVTVVVQ
jgi:hypothetical protein